MRGRALVAERDVEAVLDRMLEAACNVTDARYAAVGVLDESRTQLQRFLTRGIDPDTYRAIGDLPHGRGVLGVLIEDPRPLRLADVNGHPYSYGFPANHPPMKTFLGVPLMIRGAPGESVPDRQARRSRVQRAGRGGGDRPCTVGGSQRSTTRVCTRPASAGDSS